MTNSSLDSTTAWPSPSLDQEDKARPLRALWLAWARAQRIYHRYEVHGLGNLDGRAKLIVGYHARGYAADLIILSAELYRRFGQLPVSFIHRFWRETPVLRWICEQLDLVSEDGPQLQRAISAGRHVLLMPGGIREANRSLLVRRTVDWGERTGYLRLALRHGLSIVPVASAGADLTFLGLNNGYIWGKRLRLPRGLPAWVGIGPLGTWPLSPPFPVKFVQLVGPPFELGRAGLSERSTSADFLRVSRRIQVAVASLLYRAQRLAKEATS